MEFHELQQIVESNARSIAALSDDIAALRLTFAERDAQTQEERAELRRATIGIANLLESLDSEACATSVFAVVRPTILRKLNNIENKIDRLLDSR